MRVCVLLSERASLSVAYKPLPSELLYLTPALAPGRMCPPLRSAPLWPL